MQLVRNGNRLRRPLRCLPRIRSASPPRGSSRSNASGRCNRITISASCSRRLCKLTKLATKLCVPLTVPSYTSCSPMLVISTILSQKTSFVASSCNIVVLKIAALCNRSRSGACFQTLSRRTWFQLQRRTHGASSACLPNAAGPATRLPAAQCPSWSPAWTVPSFATTSRAAKNFSPLRQLVARTRVWFSAHRSVGARNRDSQPYARDDPAEYPYPKQQRRHIVYQSTTRRCIVDPALTAFASHLTDPSVAHRWCRNSATWSFGSSENARGRTFRGSASEQAKPSSQAAIGLRRRCVRWYGAGSRSVVTRAAG